MKKVLLDVFNMAFLLRAGFQRPWMCGAVVSRGRRRESCAAAEIAGFRGPVREIGCARARRRARRGEIVAGAGNPLICGCNFGMDVS